jgi:polysaccharide biosynthesis protein PelF
VVGLLLDPARRRVMGQAASWRVKTHFSIDRMVAAYAAAYRAPATSATMRDAPMAVPAPAEAMSVSDATRSVV